MINSQGRGSLDTTLDQNASTVNSLSNSIPGISSKINQFTL